MIIFILLSLIMCNNSIIVYTNESKNVIVEVMLRNYYEKVVNSYVMYKKNDILLNKYNITLTSQKFFYEKDDEIKGEIYISSAKNYSNVVNIISYSLPKKDFLIGAEYYLYSFTENDKTFSIGPFIFLETGSFSFDAVNFVSDEFEIKLLPAENIFKFKPEESDENLKKISFKEIFFCLVFTLLFLVVLLSIFFLYKRFLVGEKKK